MALSGLPAPGPIPLKDRARLVFVERAQLAVVADGAFVGDQPARTRAMIWEQVSSYLEAGDAVMVWKAPTDQGFDFTTAGRNRRMPVDFDGLNLVSFLHRARPRPAPPPRPLGTTHRQARSPPEPVRPVRCLTIVNAWWTKHLQEDCSAHPRG